MEQEGKMKAQMISGEELSRRARLRLKGLLSTHFETVDQYKIRLEHFSEETSPIEFVPYSQPVEHTDVKGVFFFQKALPI